MTEGRFSAEDLAPSDEERAAARRWAVERAATGVAVLSIGMWTGGLVALGACAAPFVFRIVPSPYNGDAMGAAFARFDSIALGAVVLALGGEVARTWAARRRGRTVAARIRRALAVALACAAAFVALSITPRILALHQAGARRGFGEDGVELERIHKTAELVGKLELAGGLALIMLHVFTLGPRRLDTADDDEDDALAPAAGPLPPGRLR